MQFEGESIHDSSKVIPSRIGWRVWMWEQLPWTCRRQPSFWQFVYSTEKLRSLASRGTFLWPECVFNWRRGVTVAKQRYLAGRLPGFRFVGISSGDFRVECTFPISAGDSSRTGHNWTPSRLDIGWICIQVRCNHLYFFYFSQVGTFVVSHSLFVSVSVLGFFFVFFFFATFAIFWSRFLSPK